MWHEPAVLAQGKTAPVQGGVLSASRLQTSVQMSVKAELASDSSDAALSLGCEPYVLAVRTAVCGLETLVTTEKTFQGFFFFF